MQMERILLHQNLKQKKPPLHRGVRVGNITIIVK